MNKLSCALWFHPRAETTNNSIVCQGCEVHHWHLLFIPDVTLTNDSAWKSVRHSARQVGIGIVLQNVNNPIGLCAHLHRAPRMFFGVRELAMAEFVVKGYKDFLNKKQSFAVSDIEVDLTCDDDDGYTDDDGAWSSLGFKIQKQKEVSTSDSGMDLLNMFDVYPTVTEYQPASMPDWEPTTSRKRNAVDAELSEDNWESTRHKKLTATAKRIREISELFKEYTCKDLLTLLQLCKDNKDHYDIAYAAFTAHNQKNIEDKAAQLAVVDDESTPLIQLMIDANILACISSKFGVLTISQTRDLFLDWCKEQNIDAGELLLEYYQVLSGISGKKNGLILQGQSNAGKTLWLDAMLYLKDVVGYVTKSENFAFQSLPGSRLARCDEIQLNPGNVDDWKRLLSEEEFTVGVKNQGDKKLSKLPVFGSCNNTFVQFITVQDAQAINNRVFLYSGLVQSTILQSNYDDQDARKPNPEFFRKVLQEIHSAPVGKILEVYNSLVSGQNDDAAEEFMANILSF